MTNFGERLANDLTKCAVRQRRSTPLDRLDQQAPLVELWQVIQKTDPHELAVVRTRMKKYAPSTRDSMRTEFRARQPKRTNVVRLKQQMRFAVRFAPLTRANKGQTKTQHRGQRPKVSTQFCKPPLSGTATLGSCAAITGYTSDLTMRPTRTPAPLHLRDEKVANDLANCAVRQRDRPPQTATAK